MSSSILPRAALGVLIAGVICVGCDSKPPSPTPVPQLLKITFLSPNNGPADSAAPVTVFGNGFQPGATVAFDGTRATVSSLSSTAIGTMVPAHAAGSVTVVVTNPGGESATIAGGYTYLAMQVSSIEPTRGLIGTTIRIAGSGFAFGAVATMDGVPVIHSTLSGAALWVTVPIHALGTVDVTVTNPGGQRRTLPRAFTYEEATVTASAGSVTAGGPLSVTWVTPSGRSNWDWIGLFKVGASNESYEHGWWGYTNGLTSGTLITTAPLQPGQYEFRYFVEDGLVEATRSAMVTVTAEPGQALLSRSHFGLR
jgi:hypothetical protein